MPERPSDRGKLLQVGLVAALAAGVAVNYFYGGDEDGTDDLPEAADTDTPSPTLTRSPAEDPPLSTRDTKAAVKRAIPQVDQTSDGPPELLNLEKLLLHISDFWKVKVANDKAGTPTSVLEFLRTRGLDLEAVKKLLADAMKTGNIDAFEFAEQLFEELAKGKPFTGRLVEHTIGKRQLKIENGVVRFDLPATGEDDRNSVRPDINRGLDELGISEAVRKANYAASRARYFLAQRDQIAQGDFQMDLDVEIESIDRSVVEMMFAMSNIAHVYYHFFEDVVKIGDLQLGDQMLTIFCDAMGLTKIEFADEVDSVIAYWRSMPSTGNYGVIRALAHMQRDAHTPEMLSTLSVLSGGLRRGFYIP